MPATDMTDKTFRKLYALVLLELALLIAVFYAFTRYFA